MWSLEVIKKLNEQATAKEEKPAENPTKNPPPPITGQSCHCGEKGCSNNGR